MSHHFVEIKDLHYTYPDGTAALRGLSFRIGHGETVALVGANGAGKSTLLLHLNGCLIPEAGTVRIGDFPLTKKTLPHVRRTVGMVFQDPDDQLFMPSVFDDVAFGPIYQGLKEAEVRARVDKALDEVHMRDYVKRVSHHLSVGEKKRIAIATVLSMQPEILVLDEPTAGMDPRARRTLINQLRELPQTMLVSTHDLRLVQELFPRTIIMDDGRVVADGPTSQLLNDEALLNAHGLEKM